MTKEEMIELLTEHKENQAKLELKRYKKKKYEERLKKYKRIESSTTSSMGLNQDIHSKNKISNKTENAVIETIELNEKEIEEAKIKIKELTKEIEELEEKVAETNIRLKCLKYKEKQILCAYYVDGRSYEDIGKNLYFKLFNETREVKSIKTIIKKATEKMINL